MSSAKQYNLPVSAVIPLQATSANKTSLVSDIFMKDNVTYQYLWTGTLNGSFVVETSLDYVPNSNGNPQSSPLNAGTWDTVPIGSGAVAVGSPDHGTIELNNLGPRYVRTRFVYSSGSGNLTVNIVGKAV